MFLFHVDLFPVLDIEFGSICELTSTGNRNKFPDVKPDEFFIIFDLGEFPDDT
jgi:hypothetical protein